MTLDELNELTLSEGFGEFVRVCEARQVKALSRIADDIVSRPDVRLILVCGASSAGKTTTAKRLCTQLRVNGRESVLLSTDDYFVGDARNPVDENGELDYETVEAVDIPRLVSDIRRLTVGEAVCQRRFDFLRRDGYDAEKPTRLPAGGYLVLEGIHALNPRLTEGIACEHKFGLFVEPTSQPVVFDSDLMQPSHARLLRRLVRDNRFRKLDPLKTFTLWPKVLAGEEKWINPFRGRADAAFDSALAYELSVLRPYVAGLLAMVCRNANPPPLARFLSDLIALVKPASPADVPGDSILRETIGNSQLEY